MSLKKRCPDRKKRRAATVAITVVTIPVLVAFTALSVDVGVLYNVRAELQRTADAAALAAAAELLDEDRLAGGAAMALEIEAARDAAVSVAAANPVQHASPVVDRNDANEESGDVLIGYINDPSDQSEALSTENPDIANSVRVRVRRDPERNGAVKLYFASIFGIDTSNLSAEATATFKDGVVGFSDEGASDGETVKLLPFALRRDTYLQLLAGTYPKATDNYTAAGKGTIVAAGGDGIPELNLYPGAGASQLPPGNCGTVDICNPNNSTADLARQVLDGVNADDLSYCDTPGEIRLIDGEVSLNGDTGISAGVKDELEEIIGQERLIPLFSETYMGPGNNTMYRVVGFGGITILSVDLTGSKKSKEVIIQPAHVVEPWSITEPGSGPSYFVYEPPRLVR